MYGVYPGFMKAPFDKYICNSFNSNREFYFEKEWGWGLSTVKGCDFIWRRQHTLYRGEKIELGKAMDTGDKFGFRVYFDKRICEILFNGKVVGNAFTEIPDEIIPVICESVGGMTVLIEFLNGIARV